MTFRSALVPTYIRKTRSLEAAPSCLYLKGVLTGEIEEVLKILVRPDAQGLSENTIACLKQTWMEEYQQ